MQKLFCKQCNSTWWVRPCIQSDILISRRLQSLYNATFFGNRSNSIVGLSKASKYELTVGGNTCLTDWRTRFIMALRCFGPITVDQVAVFCDVDYSGFTQGSTVLLHTTLIGTACGTNYLQYCYDKFPFADMTGHQESVPGMIGFDIGVLFQTTRCGT